MAPPDLTIAGVVFRAMLETVQIALLGTALGAVLAVGFGLLAAANLTPAWVHQPVKWLLGAIRGVPVILLALMFVSAYGLGPLPGVAAIALHSTGMLGKFYAEAFEAARPGPIEALRTTGAAWPQIVRFAVLPQIAPRARPRHAVPLRAQFARVARARPRRRGRNRLLHPALRPRLPLREGRHPHARGCWRWWCWWSRRASSPAAV